MNYPDIKTRLTFAEYFDIIENNYLSHENLPMLYAAMIDIDEPFETRLSWVFSEDGEKTKYFAEKLLPRINDFMTVSRAKIQNEPLNINIEDNVYRLDRIGEEPLWLYGYCLSKVTSLEEPDEVDCMRVFPNLIAAYLYRAYHGEYPHNNDDIDKLAEDVVKHAEHGQVIQYGGFFLRKWLHIRKSNSESQAQTKKPHQSE